MATDETPLEFFGIAGILQFQPLKRGFDSLDPSPQKLVQKLRNPTPVNTPDAAVNERPKIAQDQPLRQQEFKPIGSHLGQRPRNPESPV